MTPERAIEILDPEHREHYESIEPVNEACRMGAEAISKLLIPKTIRPDFEGDKGWGLCPSCCASIYMTDIEQYQNNEVAHCHICGQALKAESENEY